LMLPLPCRILTLAFLTIASITHVKPFQQATPVRCAANWIGLSNNTGRWMPDVKDSRGIKLPGTLTNPLPLLPQLRLSNLHLTDSETNDEPLLNCWCFLIDSTASCR
jgi:hypothetical protein